LSFGSANDIVGEPDSSEVREILALYDDIGHGYDGARRADPFIAGRLMYHIGASPAGRYLDLACGSGNYTVALRRKGVNIAGIDISANMLRLARQKDPAIDWVLGDVEALPFRDRSFHGATCVLAIHHVGNMQSMFTECSRVIKERLVVFTATPEQMEYYWLNDYFPDAMKKSAEQMPSQLRIEEALKKSGFSRILWEPYNIRDDLQDGFLYAGKNKPEMYLDPRIRAGISTFTSIANPGEIEAGCQSLEADIRSGRIQQVLQIYHGQGGDYMFATGVK
jgi:SAM-dependent methyltransferase